MKTKQYAFFVALVVAVAIAVCAYPAVAQTADGPESEKRVTLHFKDVPVSNAIAILFEGINYVPEPGIQGAVTLSLNDVPFTDALQALLKAAGLTAVKESGIYYIRPQRELPVEIAAPPQLIAETELELERERIPEKIPVGYADARDVRNFIYGQGTGYGGGGGMMGGGMMGGGMMGGYGGGGMMGGGMMGGGMMGGGMMGGGMMGGGYGGGGYGGGGYGGGGYGGGGYGGGGYGGGGGMPRW